jgi:pimeloyl-ACP methyl ester carboxylesterase
MRREGSDVQTRRVRVRGIEMAYEDFGPDSRPLVLVHGFTGSRRDFQWRFEALAKIGRVVALDLRGHGESTNTGDPASYTLDAIAEDLLAFLDATGIEACDLLGHSMGGMAVLRAALARCDRIASLILMNTSARCPEGLPRALLELAGRIAIEAGSLRIAEVMRARAADPDTDRSEADRRLEAQWGDAYWTAWRYPNFRALDPFAYGAFGAAMLDQAPLLDRLGEIRVPTTVLVGSGDTGFLAPSDELVRGIPGARRSVIPDAAHQPQFENPDAWVAAIEAHLAHARGASFPGS